MPAPEPGPPSSRAMRLAAGGAGVLVVVAAASFYYASRNTQADAPDGATRVSITASACEPDEITVPAGRRSFTIANRSDRPVEWEILDGVMVVAERENIAPGYEQTFSTDLAPGDYEVTCGLLTNPRGTLHVAPSDKAGSGGELSLQAFIGALSEYRFYMLQQTGALVETTQALADAIAADDRGAARARYAAARGHFKRLEPVVFRFSDLANRINPSAAYLKKKEDDPGFTGFHRIAYTLFADKKPEGVEQAAKKLVTDTETLKARIEETALRPTQLVGGAAQIAHQLAASRVETGEDRYSGRELADIRANLAGIDKIVTLVAPVVEETAPAAVERVTGALDEARRTLAGLKTPDGDFPDYGAIAPATRKELAGHFAELGRALDALEPITGVGET